MLDGEISRHSAQTPAIRRFPLDKLTWFLTTRGCERCGTLGLRQFLAHATRGHRPHASGLCAGRIRNTTPPAP